MKALFLDFDGTLVDSLGLLWEIYNRTLRKFGAAGSREEFDRLNGASTEQIAVALHAAHGFDLRQELFTETFQTGLLNAYRAQVAPFPGTEVFLQEMRKRGVLLYLVTSATAAIVQGCLEANGLWGYFADLITAEGLISSKPHPAIYERALMRAGLGREDAIAIEDAPHGITAALGAGIPTIAMDWYGSEEMSRPKGVLARARSWEEILVLLPGNS